MDASLLRTLIEIWKETTAINAVGTPKETYTLYKNTYANKKFISGNKAFETMGTNVESRYVFTIRWDSNVNYKCRIKLNDSFYTIDHINMVGRNDWLTLECSLYEKETRNDG